ncbi:Protein angel 1 [Podila verticillata]|nr:Protein angel 1 [Podila verticillata]
MGNNTPNQREWSNDVQGDHFTLMTYNLLSKTLCQSHKELYSNCHPKALSWDKRSKALFKEIKPLDLDIYCFQELDQDDYVDLFEPKFRSWGYTGFYQRRTGDRNDGCALFYRSQKVKAVLIRGVEYNWNTFIGRDNVGIVAILEVTQGRSRKKFCVATTHILFNPRRGMTKIAQLKMLLEAARLLIEEQEEDIPLVLCGDMNAAPESFVLQYLKNENVDATTQLEIHMSTAKPHSHWVEKPSGTYLNGIAEFHASFSNIRQDLAAVLGTTYRPQLATNHLHTPGPDVLTQMANMHIPGIPQHQQHRHHHHHQQQQHHQQHHRQHHQHHQRHHQQQEQQGSSYIVSQPFRLLSAYQHEIPLTERHARKKYRQWTTYHTASKQMCDFIMYGHLQSTATTTTPQHQTPSRLQATATLVLPCRVLDRCNGLPIRNFGSDHLSLATKFQFV